MKPHEETWNLQNGALFAAVEVDPYWTVREMPPFARVVGPTGGSDEQTRTRLARMNLAAYAPEMARMLLSLEFDHGECIACGGIHHDKPPHRDGCEWLTLMRSAGVR